MISTKDSIVSLFGYNEFCLYNDMGRMLQEKYRLYITRRINANVFYNSNTLSPSDWLEQYDKKKTFDYIASELNMSIEEVEEVYESALKKMKRFFDGKNLTSDDF